MNVPSTIAELHSPAGTLVSVYLGRPAGASSALLSDLLKPIRAAADERERAVAKAIKATSDRIHDLAPRIDAEPWPAVAVFASEPDDLFEYLPLQADVWDVATVGPRPYLRPLRAIPELLCVGVVVADRERAFVFASEDGKLERLGEPIEADRGKDNYGGFSGYEEHRVRGRAEEETSRMLHDAADLLFERHRQKPFDMLALGGHAETLEELVPHLHAYLRSLPMHRFVVDPHTMTEAILRRHVTEGVAAYRRQLEERAVEEVLARLGSGDGAVAGTSAVLKATNARAVERLVVSGRFERSGVLCDECGWLGRSGDGCPVCGARLFDVDDVIGPAIEAVLGAGGEALQVSVASALDSHGVAATVRFPIS